VVVVRQAAVNALRHLGSAARKALPGLIRYASTQPLANPTANADEVKVEMMESDLRRDIRDLINKLK
ncbi:MAG: hypothetical protein ABI565_05280, partial [Vicinamibacteria bacterium]